jgi:phosphatidylglycerol:prolipoprotein diacylglycerol transferase
MLNYPVIDPVAISLGPVNVYWYGLMYLVGFVAGALLGQVRSKRQDLNWQPKQVWDLVFFIAIGVIVGGRLGYIVFYNLEYYLDRPIEWLFIWSGGMSFHGGLLGVLLSLWLFSRRNQKSFLEVGDFVAPLCPLGFGAGRVGNFINQELWGRVSEVPWAMVFPAVGPETRHPSQLYEALLEGIVLFVIVWLYSKRPRATGAISGIFLLSYGVLRFSVEFFREPDIHLGVVALGWVTMGQLLSIPMALLGFGLWIHAIRQRR